MTLNLDALAAAPAEMPRTARGRQATPVPAAILDAVKSTYNGTALAYTVPLANKDGEDYKQDENVKTLVATLRRAGTAHGLGMAFGYERPNKANAKVIFQAKDKIERQRATKPTDIFVAEDEDGNVYEVEQADGRLATIAEAKVLGYVYDYDNAAWVAGDDETSENGAG